MAEPNLDSTSTDGTTNSTAQKGENSIDAAKLQAAIDNLTKRLDDVDNRARTVQGEKDKVLSKTSKEVEEIKRQIAEIEKLKKSGFDPDAAIEEFTFREEVRGLREQLAKLNPASTATAGNGNSGVATEAQRIAAGLQLDMNDKDIAAAVGSGDVLNVMKVVLSKQSPSASAHDAPPPGGTPPSNKDVDTLTAEYKQKVKAARGNRTTISQLREQYKKDGVDVYNVDFS